MKPEKCTVVWASVFDKELQLKLEGGQFLHVLTFSWSSLCFCITYFEIYSYSKQ